MGSAAAVAPRRDICTAVRPLLLRRDLHLFEEVDWAGVILDEAQNTTPMQMKMFLTRLGFHSKVVVTGDITQIDLPAGKVSGLIEAREVLAGIEGIAFSYFTEVDVVRHALVQEIIKAYERDETQNNPGNL